MGTPYIYGTFSNWESRAMRNVVDFCKEYDENPPPFLQEAINDFDIRQEVQDTVETMNDDERRILRKR